jgi:hypothetical protein
VFTPDLMIDAVHIGINLRALVIHIGVAALVNGRVGAMERASASRYVTCCKVWPVITWS